ncbi:DUF2637 domain-containing protein [Streptomyces sp. NBC_00258]|uniref:DUF2637 domain-containing protein n=1 Tax=Streptomyces sp. NBC_00258 TaxID=2903642 RepID=UPI002E29F37B|nr:DUF2637 domain-containing protein [Streptomyces sp. NBC_00258]
MKRLSARQTLAGGAGLVTVTLTAAAFWLSYEHLHDVADDNGLGGIRAWAWPGTVDLFIVAGELLILRAALRGRADWFAYLLAGVGSLGSIALNVAGVGTGADPLEYIVAAVPPVAALLAFAAIMRQVHEQLVSDVETEALDVIQTLPAATVERVPEVYPEIEAAVPAVPEAVPGGVRLLPVFGCPGELHRALRHEIRHETPTPVPAAEYPRTRPAVHAEYVPDSDRQVPDPGPDDEPDEEHEYPDPLIPQVRRDFPGETPGVRRLKEKYGIGQPRAQRIRDELTAVTS